MTAPLGSIRKERLAVLPSLDLDRQRTDQQPDAQFLGQRREGRQRRVMRLVKGLRQFGAAIGRHQGGVLRRGDESRAAGGGLADQVGGDADIFRDIVAGAKLDAGGAEFRSIAQASSGSSLPALVQGIQLVKAADMGVADENLRHGARAAGFGQHFLRAPSSSINTSISSKATPFLLSSDLARTQ